jgi:hypothetical protein
MTERVTLDFLTQAVKINFPSPLLAIVFGNVYDAAGENGLPVGPPKPFIYDFTLHGIEAKGINAILVNTTNGGDSGSSRTMTGPLRASGLSLPQYQTTRGTVTYIPPGDPNVPIPSNGFAGVTVFPVPLTVKDPEFSFTVTNSNSDFAIRGLDYFQINTILAKDLLAVATGPPAPIILEWSPLLINPPTFRYLGSTFFISTPSATHTDMVNVAFPKEIIATGFPPFSGDLVSEWTCTISDKGKSIVVTEG